MKKKIGCFLIAISAIIFIYGLANAQSFLLQLTDANGDGSINFTVLGVNPTSVTIDTGLATPDHTTIYPPLTIPAFGTNATSVSIPVTAGGSVTYDVYLTDGVNYLWTSQAAALGSTTGGSFVVEWELPAYNWGVSFTDKFNIVAVPIPPALLLLGSGIVALGVLRRRKVMA